MSAAQASPEPEAVLIQELLSEIQTALARVQTDLAGAGIPPLQSVTLALVAEARRNVGGRINLFIVSFGHKWEKDRTQSIELTLKPPKPTAPVKLAETPSIADQLASALVSAAKGVQAARENQSAPLVTSALKVTLNFVVKADTAASGKFTIAPITADLSGDLSSSAIHKITVTY